MAFCINCGQELVEGTKFCASCGKAVNDIKLTNKRTTVYDGEVHKCPNCGDIIDAYETICEACGFEIRGRKATSVVYELALKLEKIEDCKREEVIRDFYIPNTKEDIYEFFILAISNIKAGSEDSKAWFVKLEQVYQKAKFLFGDSKEFDDVKGMYLEANKSYKKRKKIDNISKFGNELKRKISISDVIIVGVLLLLLAIPISASISHKRHIAKLEKIVAEVNEHIKEEEYDLAKSKVAQIYDDTEGHSDSKKKWEDVRKTLINTIEQKEKNNNDVEKVYTYENFEFRIPASWKEEGSKPEYNQFYAEKGDKFAMISIAYPVDSDPYYSVTFDGLSADNENMIDMLESMFTDGKVIEHKVYENNFGVKGILYHYTFKQKINLFKSINAQGYCFCFPSEKDRRWFYVYYMQSDDAFNDNKEEYFQLLSIIKEGEKK